MSINKISTPVLYEKNGKKYLLMHITLMEDGSIYFTYPHKPPRYITQKRVREYARNGPKEGITELYDYEKLVLEPKISFHPRDMILHINSNITIVRKENFELLNIALIDGMVCTYILQCIFPKDITLYDEYLKSKHKDYIVLEDSKLDNNAIMLEFIVHSPEITPSIGLLPFCKTRNYKQEWKFIGSNKYTYSIFASTIHIEDTFKSILININTKTHNCILNLGISNIT